MLQPWRTGIVIRIRDETPSTKRFWIQVPELASFDFTPGQFVTLELPIHEKPNKRWRSYSIASWPDGSNVFELVIVILDGGAGTHYLFHEVQEGAALTLRGPQGVFVLPDPIDRDLFFICTGTGIAPFRSMCHHILNQGVSHESIYLVFGCRLFGDSLYADELRALESRVTSLRYIPTFSREAPGDYHTGYVHSIYEQICKENRMPAPDNSSGWLPKPAYFFLCGWKDMIDEARQRIQNLGYDRKMIHQELYG